MSNLLVLFINNHCAGNEVELVRSEKKKEDKNKDGMLGGKVQALFQ